MPRGGRRPGAGARRGNFNALKSGNNSERMALVYARLLIEPDRLTVGRALAEAGMIKPPPWQFQRSDIPRLIEFLWLYWFDRSEENNQKQSKTIKDNQ